MTYIIDAKNKILGRVATEAVRVLTGKHEPGYAPYLKPRHKVTIQNAAHIRVTGKKPQAKIYKRYSGYPSGLKKLSFEILFEKNPKRIVEHAIRSMLPKNKLRADMMRNLTILIHE
ncbi:MAG: large subunit ribosomal protein L13 [Parcubacteria group bacterium Gr01-1014_70]|nr:MAG: large subunit ribosomal protein L13 [Parcubacteria group bacterium Gr01-1014_70]